MRTPFLAATLLLLGIACALVGRTAATFSDQASVTGNTFTSGTWVPWHDADWGFRKMVIIDSSKVTGDLTDFPVLVSIASDADLAADAQDDGDDILFTSPDGTTKLSHEIESFDGATGQLVAWVKVPTLPSTPDTVLYMYYGNDLVGNQQDPTGVWDSNFKMALHLKEPPSGAAGEMKDSTSNANHGTTEGGMDAADSVDAKIGKGLDFDEVNDLIRVADSASLDGVNDEGTIQLWIWWDSAADGDHQIVMSSSNRFTVAAMDGLEWASQGSGNHFFYPWGGNVSNYNLGPNPFTNQISHHLVVTLKNSTTREVKIYVDTVPMTFTTENVPTYWTQLASIADWLWGGNPDRPTRYFDGVMDEIRVSDIVRPVDWLTTEYYNQNSPSTFFRVGSEQSAP